MPSLIQYWDQPQRRVVACVTETNTLEELLQTCLGIAEQGHRVLRVVYRDREVYESGSILEGVFV